MCARVRVFLSFFPLRMNTLNISLLSTPSVNIVAQFIGKGNNEIRPKMLKKSSLSATIIHDFHVVHDFDVVAPCLS